MKEQEGRRSLRSKGKKQRLCQDDNVRDIQEKAQALERERERKIWTRMREVGEKGNREIPWALKEVVPLCFIGLNSS